MRTHAMHNYSLETSIKITSTNLRMQPIRTYVVFELPWEQRDKTLPKLIRLRVTSTEFSLKTREARVLRQITYNESTRSRGYLCHKSSQFVHERVLETTGNFPNTLYYNKCYASTLNKLAGSNSKVIF